MPIGVDTTIPISYYKEVLSSYTHVPVADYETLIKAHDKYRTIETARRIGIPGPETQLFSGESRSIYPVKYPVVVKARKGTSGYGTRYTSSPVELESIFRSFESLDSNPIEDFNLPMIQEYIPGEIRDVCVLFNHGEPRAAVAQRRVLTYPPKGGVGIVNETMEDPYLIELAIRLLREIRWHGVAQVEFKLDLEGIPRLMEVNPKFWGTLELSIAAGVNFPYMLYEMTVEGDVEPCLSYSKNIQIWWLFAHYPQLLFAFKNDIQKCLKAIYDKRTRKMWDLHLMDIKPHLIQILEGIIRLKNFKKLITHSSTR